MFGVAQVVQASCKIVAETCLGQAILGRNAGNSVGVVGGHIAVPLCVFLCVKLSIFTRVGLVLFLDSRHFFSVAVCLCVRYSV